MEDYAAYSVIILINLLHCFMRERERGRGEEREREREREREGVHMHIEGMYPHWGLKREN